MICEITQERAARNLHERPCKTHSCRLWDFGLLPWNVNISNIVDEGIGNIMIHFLEYWLSDLRQVLGLTDHGSGSCNLTGKSISTKMYEATIHQKQCNTTFQFLRLFSVLLYFKFISCFFIHYFPFSFIHVNQLKCLLKLAYSLIRLYYNIGSLSIWKKWQ